MFAYCEYSALSLSYFLFSQCNTNMREEFDFEKEYPARGSRFRPLTALRRPVLLLPAYAHARLPRQHRWACLGGNHPKMESTSHGRTVLGSLSESHLASQTVMSLENVYR